MLLLSEYMALKVDSDKPSLLFPTSGIKSDSVLNSDKRFCISIAESLSCIARLARATPTELAVRSEKLKPDLYLAS